MLRGEIMSPCLLTAPFSVLLLRLGHSYIHSSPHFFCYLSLSQVSRCCVTSAESSSNTKRLMKQQRLLPWLNDSLFT